MTTPIMTRTGKKVLERLSQVTLPNNLQPQMGTGLEPGRPDLLVHAEKSRTQSNEPDGIEIY